jgi:hypothetical protein
MSWGKAGIIPIALIAIGLFLEWLLSFLFKQKKYSDISIKDEEKFKYYSFIIFFTIFLITMIPFVFYVLPWMDRFPEEGYNIPDDPPLVSLFLFVLNCPLTSQLIRLAVKKNDSDPDPDY